MKSIEHIIIALLRKKDNASIPLIIEHYGDTLYGIACRMMGDAEQAEDVMQDSFIKIWKNATDYDPKKAKLFTWLLAIVRNTAIDKIRKRNTYGENHLKHLITNFI